MRVCYMSVLCVCVCHVCVLCVILTGTRRCPRHIAHFPVGMCSSDLGEEGEMTDTEPHVRTHVRTSLCSAHGPPHYLSLAHMLISVHKGFSVGQGRIGSEPRFGLETCSILISHNTHLTHLLMTLNDHQN